MIPVLINYYRVLDAVYYESGDVGFIAGNKWLMRNSVFY